VSNVAPKGNVGEWSELFALAYLLVQGGAYSANSDQEPNHNLYYKVLQIVIADEGLQGEIRYDIRDDHIAIFEDGYLVTEVDKNEIKRQTDFFFVDLTSGTGKKTFALDSGQRLMALLNKKSISAASSERETDLSLVIADHESGGPTPRYGFSIKSQLGQPSTLLNSSGSTNIIYEILSSAVSGKFPLPDISKTASSHPQNVRAILEAGYTLKFHGYQSEIFAENLSYVDSQLPEHLAKVVLESYVHDEIKGFSAVAERVFSPTEKSSEQPLFKLREFLGAVSMGLRPNTVWRGNASKFKGLMLVKQDGTVLFYYLNSRLNFEEYLYKNVRFERPSTKRHKYGFIFEEDASNFIKLNLQIRFQR